MKLVVRFLALVLLLMFSAQTCSFFYQPGNSSQPLKDISYSRFMEEAGKGNINSVVFESSGIISVNFKNPIGGESSFKVSALPIDMAFVESMRREILAKNPNAVIDSKLVRETNFFGIFLAWLPLLFLIGVLVYIGKMIRRGGPKNFMSFGKSAAKLSPENKKTTFADVAGADEAKEELQEIVDFLREPQKFQRLGGRIPKGVLLIGPPGTGKTLIARAVAGEANVPFFFIAGSDFIEMFVGVGASRVRSLFSQAKASTPCIIFIDEIDAVGRHRSTAMAGGHHEEREQTLNQLLVEMDGFETNAGVIIIAASNRPDILDHALLRPGRFDRRVALGLPDIKGREEILSVHTKDKPIDNSADIMRIARGTPGFSGADLANLVNEAALNAARAGRDKISQNDFEFAKEKVLMGGERRSMVISDNERRTTAIHEAGHAIMALVMPEADPLEKVTIIPRGLALGLTAQLPVEDKHNYSKIYLTAKLAILFGGRCAEEILLGGQQTTGASNDFEKATEIAGRMVREWGMSDLGPISFPLDKSNPLADITSGYSEETVGQIDRAVKKLLREAYDLTKKTITERRLIVRKIADALIEYETLSGDRIREIARM